MPKPAHSAPPASLATERVIQQLRRQLLLVTFGQHALRYGAGWLLGWGLLALVWRVVAQATSAKLLWGAAGLLGVGVVASWQVWRRCPAEATLRAWLDQQNHCGGLLMAAGEGTLGAWEVPALSAPRLRWRSRQPLGLFALAATFLAASLLLPVRLPGSSTARAFDLTREAEQLKAELTALQEAGALTEEKAQSFEQQLQQVQHEATASDPVKSWEALDQLNDALSHSAREAAQQQAQQQQQLDQAAALTKALQTGASQLNEQTLTEAMQTLSSLTQQALQNEAQALPRELQQALQAGKLNAAQLQQLAQALQQKQGRLNQQLSKLAQSGLIKPGDLKQGATAGQRDHSGLAKHLAEHAQKQPLAKTLGDWCAGKGGVTRGRADAELNFGEMAREEGAKFKEKTLPPAAVSELQNSQLLGLSAAAPAVQTGAAAAHGALNQTAARGGSAYTQTVLPRHKGAVKRYFDRK
jgi:septal ring factor EnvC (AmiA/AmiB activator)